MLKNSDDFNEKYKDYLEKGYYGLALNDPKIIEYLDKEFEELIKLPGFSYSQIKEKFPTSRFYVEGVSSDKINEIEQHLNTLLKTN